MERLDETVVFSFLLNNICYCHAVPIRYNWGYWDENDYTVIVCDNDYDDLGMGYIEIGKNIMTLEEIKQAVDEGQVVCWACDSYKVIKDHKGQYLIQHTNCSCIGLTYRDGVTLNGDSGDFYIVSI